MWDFDRQIKRFIGEKIDEKILMPIDFVIRLWDFLTDFQMISDDFYHFQLLKHINFLLGKPLVFEHHPFSSEGQRSVSKAGPPKRCSAGPGEVCLSKKYHWRIEKKHEKKRMKL